MYTVHNKALHVTPPGHIDAFFLTTAVGLELKGSEKHPGLLFY